MPDGLTSYALLAVVSGFLAHKTFVRLRLSRAKHASVRGHAKWSRRLARLVPYYSFGDENYFCADGAPSEIDLARRKAMQGLRRNVLASQPQSLAYSSSLQDSVSDVNFTAAYRVPFPFREGLPDELKQGSIIEESSGVQVRDIDGNWRYDLTGSYGVNVFGYDFYKACMDDAQRLVGDMGPVLGPYHPIVKDNVERIKSVSGLDEVSFHMSGTEAVMQAVGLARYHTGRSHLVRLCGAYHGWWDGVQPGVGTHRGVGDVYTLADLSENTLRVLETRNDIACVLINPLQALSPNANAAGDAALFGSKRSAYFDREAYTDWLHKIRDVCTAKSIVLIFDEVFLGFRLGYGGAQEYFGIQADMVTYGKTLGGGYPVGVLCGTHKLMKRYRDKQPANISFARGTFNSHPYVMAAMNSFLRRIEEPDCQALYAEGEMLWNKRVGILNARLSAIGAPVEIANMHSILTVLYRKPSRYNWMLQFYLRAEGLELSWIGSGRMIMSFNFSDEDFAEVMSRFERACLRMLDDGWWWQSDTLTDASIRSQLISEMLRARFPLFRSKRPTTSIIGDSRLEESS
ncbi:aminotransferase class III-fold pyridoxal phosphate-dependent enzyme [Congregibacter sp.]|uniref:aminotransferase class III-fold pyridoxal phosphate-dependent enzyme n=1 Tax=Congregibacter sp. TaxID=2744308 RepID=UPI003F6D1DCF